MTDEETKLELLLQGFRHHPETSEFFEHYQIGTKRFVFRKDQKGDKWRFNDRKPGDQNVTPLGRFNTLAETYEEYLRHEQKGI